MTYDINTKPYNPSKEKYSIEIDDEVAKLFKHNQGKVSTADFIKLKHKYGDTNAEEIQNLYLEKTRIMTKRAKKLVKIVRETYGNQQYPFHVLLEKVKIINKKKYKYSSEEFAEFQRLFEQELVGLKSPEVLQVATNMMKVLGTVSLDFQGFSTKLNDNDYKILQEILKLYTTSKPLHSQVLLQSIQYNSFDFESMSGEYNKYSGFAPTEHVHPVIAALFLPKLNVLDTHFLHSNIGGIVKARYNNEPLTNRPDYLLFHDLITDPNDVVCDNVSAMRDLLYRTQMQIQLWNCVLNLRNGQYYNTKFREFVSAVDMCKLNKQDNPDLIYGRNDGTILKRLLSAFSFRPTVVATMPKYNIVTLNPYQQNIRPIITSVSMINFRLPPSIKDETPISLDDALEQEQLFIDNGIITQRYTSLISSRGVLFFFVDRRSNVINFNETQTLNFAAPPLSLLGFEKLNNRHVDFKTVLDIKGDTYQLKSVILAEVNRNSRNKNIIVGSSTLFMMHIDPFKGNLTPTYFSYDPLRVLDTTAITDPATGSIVSREPRKVISEIYDQHPADFYDASFYKMANTRGVIFMYELMEGSKSDGEIR